MPLYQFKSVNGPEVIEEYFTDSKRPALGTIIVRKGRQFKRILSTGITFEDAKLQTERKGYNREDISLPKEDLGAGVGPHGNPIIRDKKHEREICARYGLKRD